MPKRQALRDAGNQRAAIRLMQPVAEQLRRKLACPRKSSPSAERCAADWPPRPRREYCAGSTARAFSVGSGTSGMTATKSRFCDTSALATSIRSAASSVRGGDDESAVHCGGDIIRDGLRSPTASRRAVRSVSLAAAEFAAQQNCRRRWPRRSNPSRRRAEYRFAHRAAAEGSVVLLRGGGALHRPENQVVGVARNLIGVRAADRRPRNRIARTRVAVAEARRYRLRAMRGAIESAPHVCGGGGNDNGDSAVHRARPMLPALEASAARLGRSGNSHGLSHEFLERGQARLDGVLEGITVHQRVGGLQTIAGDAQHGLLVGTDAALRDQGLSRIRR